jgi:hypothetical protein
LQRVVVQIAVVEKANILDLPNWRVYGRKFNRLNIYPLNPVGPEL